MPGIARTFTDQAGGSIMVGGNTDVRANGSIVAVFGSPVVGHGRDAHSSPSMVAASTKVRAHGIGVCRSGDRASCSHTASGSSNVRAG